MLPGIGWHRAAMARTRQTAITDQSPGIEESLFGTFGGRCSCNYRHAGYCFGRDRQVIGSSLCVLRVLCVSVVTFFYRVGQHRDTENAENAQRKKEEESCFSLRQSIS